MKKILIFMIMIITLSSIVFADQLVISDGGNAQGIFISNPDGSAGSEDSTLLYIYGGQSFREDFRMNITSFEVYFSQYRYGTESLVVGINNQTQSFDTIQNWSVSAVPSSLGWQQFNLTERYLTDRNENIFISFLGDVTNQETEWQGRNSLVYDGGQGYYYWLGAWRPQGMDFNVKINYEPCVEEWVAGQTACLNTDEILKIYTDSNDCGTYDDLPLDNASVVSSCNYCDSTYEESNTSCTTSDLIYTNYDWTNTCCADTGLSSDCDSIPSNYTTACNYCDSTYDDTTYCGIDDITHTDYDYTNTCCADTGLGSDCNIPANYTNGVCDYCVPNYTSDINGCIELYTWNNYDVCCAVTGIEEDCSIPENVTSCVGRHSISDITGLVIDGGVELGRSYILYAGLIAMVSLFIIGKKYLKRN